MHRFTPFRKCTICRCSFKDLGEKELLNSLPALPGRGIFESKTNQISREKSMQRMADLDAWLQALKKLVEGSNIHFQLLREHLELNNAAAEGAK